MKRVLIFSLILQFPFSAIFAQTVPKYLPGNGLVGWWPFNGNAIDESGNNNHGTVMGATLSNDRFGNAGKAYSFNGTSSQIRVNDSPSLRLAKGTISCWMRYSSNAKMQLLQKINFNNAQNQNYDIEINEIKGNILIRGNYGKQCANVGGGPFCSTTSLNLNNNQWFHYVGVMDNGVQKIYINGALVGSWNMASAMTACPGGDLLIGRGWSSYPLWYNGQLDDLAIWNRALSPQEISNVFNAVECFNNLAINPPTIQIQKGYSATFNASTSDSNPTYIWQSDFGQGYVNLINYGKYTGVNTKSLTVYNVELSEHNQPFRVISVSGSCIDTSNVGAVSILDTCITIMTRYDTIFTTVTDTLIIDVALSALNPPNNLNTLLVFPNPAKTHITMDFGKYWLMGGYRTRIINSTGQTVYDAPVNQQESFIDLSNWTGKGIYFIRLLDPQNNIVANKKIIIL